MTRDAGRVVLVVALLAGAVPAPAQSPDAAALRGESAQTRKRLSEAEAKVLGDKPADAVDDLQRILDDAADDLIGVGDRRFVPARWVAHGVLTKLRGDALRAYQDRLDEPARKLLAAAKQARDPQPLWALLDRYFVSRPSEEGLLLLGELLFERGDFRTAELVWRRLLPDADVPYPSPKTDPAAAWARAILATIYQGEHERATVELAAFRTKHPAAKGVLAGKDGPLADALRSLLDNPPTLADPNSRTWSTLGGGPGRSGRVGGKFPTHWPARPTWRHSPGGPLPHTHAVIADGRVYAAVGTKIASYDLRTGRETGTKEVTAFGPLTAVAGRVYARRGPQFIHAGADTAIACYDRSLNPLWELKPPAGEMKTPSVWEGTPVVAGRRMWAVVARFEGGRVNHAVACYDPADADDAPDRPAWVTEVSDSPLSPLEGGRPRHEFLTLAGRTVVFCSHAGVVVALDAATGRKAWAFRYPRAARRTGDAARSADPAPAVAAGGRVFVAPADADRVFALDAETGQPLWESAPADGAQLIGVSRGRLILTTAGAGRGLRALSVVTGSHREPDGWVQHDGGGLATHGRGVVNDDVIVWPTKAGVFFVRPDDGLPMRDPLRLTLPFPQSGHLGNVAFADGCMVIVTANEVLGYVPEARAYDPPDAAFTPALVPQRTGDPVSRPTAPHLKPADVPSLTADAEVEKTVQLPPGAYPLDPIRGAPPPKHLFASTGGRLLKVGVSNGRVAEVDTADGLTHAADFAGGVVAAGPGAVAVYADGPMPEWVFRTRSSLSSFALAGSWLFARVGEHHLVALDLVAKRVAWVLGAHGRSRYEPVVYPSCPRFESHYFLSESVLCPQLSDGRRWAVRTETGRVVNEVGSTLNGPVPHAFGTPTARAAWPGPPVEVDEGRVAFADGPGTVRGCDPHTGRGRWKWTAPDDHSLSGVPPQVRAWADGILVAVRRNHGVEVDRVNPAGGSSAWAKPVFVAADSVDLDDADADPWRAYLPVGNRLTATTLAHGKHAWEADLPETNGAGEWAVRAGRRAVFAYPRAAIPAESPRGVWERFVRSLWRQPFAWRLPAVAAGLYDAWVARTVPVLLFDPEDGKLVKQVDVPARGPGVTTAFTAEYAVVMTGDRVVWIK